MAKKISIIPVDRIQQLVLLIRGRKVMIDADLAALYGVHTKVLNQAVRRNRDRFPADFMFQLTKSEKVEVVTNCDHLEKLKYSPALPLVFSEHGALMAASVLNTPRAIEISLYVVRAFVNLRDMLSNQKSLAKKFDKLEAKQEKHDRQITVIIDAIKELKQEPVKRKQRIGFRTGSEE